MANDSDEIQMGARIKSASFFYSSRSRALLLVLSLLFATASVRGQTKIRSLTNVEGHAVGGVTVDLVGNIYVPTLATLSGRSPRRASVTYLRQAFMAPPATQSTMKATSAIEFLREFNRQD